MTSFDKLIEKICSSIKNVRLSSEPDQKPGGVTGSIGVAPDAAYVYSVIGAALLSFIMKRD